MTATFDQVALVGSDGTVWDLFDCDSEVQAAGELPIGGPGPWEVASADYRFGGARVTSTRPLAAPQRLPIALTAASRGELPALIERFWSSVRPAGGDCSLVVTRDDGIRRERRIRYEAGLSGVEMRPGGRARVSVDLLFRAHDPAWYQLPAEEHGLDDTRATLAPGTGSSDLLILENIGDLDTYPYVEITAQNAAVGAILVTAANLHPEGAASWEWTNPIQDLFGSVVIDHMAKTAIARREYSTTRPAVSVFSGFDTVRRSLWPMKPGTNSIAVQGNNPASTNLRVRFLWTPRFSTC